MQKNINKSLQICFVFIGTIVGAGLASGQEIVQFFTIYGYKSFYGILICLFMYIFVSLVIIKISLKYKLSSYSELIMLVTPNYMGKIINLATSLFLISSSSIILAGSGSLFNQFFHMSKWIGIIAMLTITLITLLNDTDGLLIINSFIVPSLITIIILIFLLYITFDRNILNINNLNIINAKNCKNTWYMSALLYGGFNLLCCCGVLVPLSTEIKDVKSLCCGSIIGSIILTLLCYIINLLLISNLPYTLNYEIPFLYIANRFGKLIEFMLLCVIFLEMFSTAVSDIYSIGKTIKHNFNISYKKAVISTLFISLLMAQVGFKNLITIFYPIFGFFGLIFILLCIKFYKKFFK